MSKKLYVGSLPYEVDDQQLEEMAKPYGEVTSAKVIMDKFSGRSKGFGFVEFANDDDAEKAIQALNDSDIGGRKIRVNEARPMEPRNRDRDRGGRRGGGGGGGGRGRGGPRW